MESLKIEGDQRDHFLESSKLATNSTNPASTVSPNSNISQNSNTIHDSNTSTSSMTNPANPSSIANPANPANIASPAITNPARLISPAYGTAGHIAEHYSQTGAVSGVELTILIFSAIAITATATISWLNYLQSFKLPLPLLDILAKVVKQDVNENNRIENVLRELRGITGCQRAVIGIFQVASPNGLIHFKKMSFRYEACSNNTGSLKKFLYDIDSRIYEQITCDAMVNSQSDCDASDKFTKFSRYDLGLNSEFCRYMDFIGLRTVYSRLLFTGKQAKDRVYYGIVELHFTSEPDNDFMADKELKDRVEEVFNNLSVCLDYIVIKRSRIPVTS